MKGVQDRVAALRPNPAVAIGQSFVPFVIAIALAFVMDKVVGPAAGATWAKILLDVGIAILLAGSLNVVNGYAGQFSIGHAGFMLAGGYAAAWLTFYGSVHWFGTKETYGGFLGSGELLFLGGWIGPGPLVLGPVWFLLKALVLFLVVIWIRWSFIRIRVDQILALSWKVFLPASVVLLLAAAAVVAARGGAGA